MSPPSNILTGPPVTCYAAVIDSSTKSKGRQQEELPIVGPGGARPVASRRSAICHTALNGGEDVSAGYPKPAVRRLKVYAFDPHASVTLSTAMANDFVIELPWEERWESPLEKGPINDYVEVIDYDPAAGIFYAPVDLNDPWLRDGGLEPSEGRPQFHQQMVFAVVMRTIRAFERALGRLVLWAGEQDPLSYKNTALDEVERKFTRRLRIYPHALREANAYYSPAKRALLFGYFQPDEDAADVQASWVFTCLSQDIIAHETTHAILHGMRQRSIEPTGIDATAFHEGFADLVALLQHFSMAPVVRQLLADHNGSLRDAGLLTGLGEQFGRATGRGKALRYALDALGTRAAAPGEGSAESIAAAIAKLRATAEPHARGGFLVAAVFDAFVTIYERRTADLFRLARPGLVPGNGLSPDLVGRLATEAATAADQVLRMCVRALDYLPPVDVRFGEYLRAIITADTDLVRDDPLRYRVAFVEAFKRWGITVPGCISMAPDSLLWDAPRPSDYPAILARAHADFGIPLADPADALACYFTDLLARLQLGVAFTTADEERPADEAAPKAAYSRTDYAPAHPGGRNLRDLAMRVVVDNQRAIHGWLTECTDDRGDWETLLGLRLTPAASRVKADDPRAALWSIMGSRGDDAGHSPPKFEVLSARISRRTGPDGFELHMLITDVVQRRRGYFDREDQAAADRGETHRFEKDNRWNEPDFWFRGGATLHIDLRDGRLLRILRKRIDDNDRLEAERAYRSGETTGEPAMQSSEPFAFVHRGM